MNFKSNLRVKKLDVPIHKIQLNTFKSKWSGPRKILRHRNGLSLPIGHDGEPKYQFKNTCLHMYLSSVLKPFDLISFIEKYQIKR